VSNSKKCCNHSTQEVTLVERQTNRWGLEYLRRHAGEGLAGISADVAEKIAVLALILIEDLGLQLAMPFKRSVALGEQVLVKVSHVDPQDIQFQELTPQQVQPAVNKKRGWGIPTLQEIGFKRSFATESCTDTNFGLRSLSTAAYRQLIVYRESLSHDLVHVVISVCRQPPHEMYALLASASALYFCRVRRFLGVVQGSMDSSRGYS